MPCKQLQSPPNMGVDKILWWIWACHASSWKNTWAQETISSIVNQHDIATKTNPHRVSTLQTNDTPYWEWNSLNRCVWGKYSEDKYSGLLSKEKMDCLSRCCMGLSIGISWYQATRCLKMVCFCRKQTTTNRSSKINYTPRCTNHQRISKCLPASKKQLMHTYACSMMFCQFGFTLWDSSTI